jgi:pimeloyl-ACP methyl ester carboxylesterase
MTKTALWRQGTKPMKTRLRLLSPARKALFIASAALFLLSWSGVLSARSGLVIRRLERDGLPLLFMAPADTKEVPAVLIAHGFGGSQQIMLGYAYKMAHAGYGVMLWDFAGHASNTFPFSRREGLLQANLDTAYVALVEQPEVDVARIALLGHSMGSGAVLDAGIQRPDRYRATIAVSPTSAPVSVDAPRNLLLMAGEWEPRFVENAEELLADGGGTREDFEAGLARDLRIVPSAEHILILFSAEAQDAAVDWLDQSFGLASQAQFTDRRLLWYGLSLLGWMVLISALAPAIRRDPTTGVSERPSPARVWLGLLWAPFAAAIVVALLDRLGDIASLGGFLVGGALAVWFLAMGGLWLLAGRVPPKPSKWAVGRGIALFFFLWLGVGALAHFVWLPWLLVPGRLARWPLMVLAFLPWLLAAGRAQSGASTGKRLLWWLAQSLLIAAGLIFSVSLVPSLSVLILVMPMLPLLFGLMSIAGGAFDEPWSFAIGNSLFFGWAMMGYFPLTG